MDRHSSTYLTLCLVLVLSIVPGGFWKCGRLLDDECPEIETDYSLLAEAVAPGFDLHDFCFVKSSQLQALEPETRKLLEGYLHGSDLSVASKNKEFDRHYD